MKPIRLTRYSHNPILTANPKNPWEAQNVSNAGVALHDGKVHLLYRAEGFKKRHGNGWPYTYLGLAISDDGFNISKRLSKPVFKPGKLYEAHGAEDPRISKIGDTYYIVYTVVSDFWDRLALATTKDFKTYQHHGLLMPEIAQRTSGLLPGKVGGQYVLFHRPIPNMWISHSRDLKTWNHSKIMFRTKLGTWYENKLGIGAPPIKTKQGWLLFWHGVDRNRRYALGIMLLDLNNPSRIIKMQEEPILTVEEDYEKTGYFPNVVYTCGAVEKDGQYLVYYGCADRCLSVATVSVEDVERFMRG
ncbi:MAG: glycosidase [Verrucomicrobiae bacterium]|nr:glycosidase [Verrucomicrobiae bacterium]